MYMRMLICCVLTLLLLQSVNAFETEMPRSDVVIEYPIRRFAPKPRELPADFASGAVCIDGRRIFEFDNGKDCLLKMVKSLDTNRVYRLSVPYNPSPYGIGSWKLMLFLSDHGRLVEVGDVVERTHIYGNSLPSLHPDWLTRIFFARSKVSWHDGLEFCESSGAQASNLDSLAEHLMSLQYPVERASFLSVLKELDVEYRESEVDFYIPDFHAVALCDLRSSARVQCICFLNPKGVLAPQPDMRTTSSLTLRQLFADEFTTPAETPEFDWCGGRINNATGSWECRYPSEAFCRYEIREGNLDVKSTVEYAVFRSPDGRLSILAIDGKAEVVQYGEWPDLFMLSDVRDCEGQTLVKWSK